MCAPNVIGGARRQVANQGVCCGRRNCQGRQARPTVNLPPIMASWSIATESGGKRDNRQGMLHAVAADT